MKRKNCKVLFNASILQLIRGYELDCLRQMMATRQDMNGNQCIRNCTYSIMDKMIAIQVTSVPYVGLTATILSIIVYLSKGRVHYDTYLKRPLKEETFTTFSTL